GQGVRGRAAGVSATPEQPPAAPDAPVTPEVDVTPTSAAPEPAAPPPFTPAAPSEPPVPSEPAPGPDGSAFAEQHPEALVVGAVVGIFAITGLIFVLQALAWGVAKALNNQNAVWIGFLVTAVLFFILAALLGLVAYRLVRKGTPPVPKMAIDEAKLVRETL